MDHPQLLATVTAAGAAVVAAIGWYASYRFSLRKDIASVRRSRDGKTLDELLKDWPPFRFEEAVRNQNFDELLSLVQRYSDVDTGFIDSRLQSGFLRVAKELKALAVVVNDPEYAQARFLLSAAVAAPLLLNKPPSQAWASNFSASCELRRKRKETLETHQRRSIVAFRSFIRRARRVA